MILIYIAVADISNSRSLRAFLAPLSNKRSLRKVLCSGQPTRVYDYEESSNMGRYVVSDGKIAKCFSAGGVTLPQATVIGMRFDEAGDYSLETFMKA